MKFLTFRRMYIPGAKDIKWQRWKTGYFLSKRPHESTTCSAYCTYLVFVWRAEACSVVVEATAGFASESIVRLADVCIVRNDTHVALIFNIHYVLLFGLLLSLPARFEGWSSHVHTSLAKGLLNFLGIDRGHPVSVMRVILFILDRAPTYIWSIKRRSY